MQRNYNTYLKDIIEPICKIERYTDGLSFELFLEDELRQDGVVKNLEVIGEAVKNLPNSVKGKSSDIDWRKIAGMRDILIHAYFGIDFEIVWGIIHENIPVLKKQIEILLDQPQ